jgi:pectin methylesterase-like acyl-CoA thioesterase
MAEQNRFEDKCALFVARGSVRRLLGQSEAAAGDFKQAYDLLDKGDKVKLQKMALCAFQNHCFITEMASAHF